MPTMDDLTALATHFSAAAPSGLGLGWGDFVAIGGKAKGDDAETVLSATPGARSTYNLTYERYRLMVAVYHPDPTVARTRAKAVADAYGEYRGKDTMTAGKFSTNGWQSMFVEVNNMGLAEAPAITGGKLYKHVVMVYLIKFGPTA